MSILSSSSIKSCLPLQFGREEGHQEALRESAGQTATRGVLGVLHVGPRHLLPEVEVEHRVLPQHGKVDEEEDEDLKCVKGSVSLVI